MTHTGSPCPSAGEAPQRKPAAGDAPFRLRLVKAIGGSLPVPAALMAYGVWLWLARDQTFYLFNFGYIGGSILAGSVVYELLPRARKHWGRKLMLVLVGTYMLGYLGLWHRENMQIEGFFLYSMAGIFAGATIHYVAAKVVGPLLFGRGWCGWVCWTVMVLDFLPWKRGGGWVKGPWKHLRYLHLALSLGMVLVAWFVLGHRPDPDDRLPELYWLVAGNTFYYVAAVGLAALLKDNRAFCKYLCPIAVLMKVPSRFSLIKVGTDAARCNDCGACDRGCPMGVRVSDYVKAGKRVLSTECTLCMTCINGCPHEALKLNYHLDAGFDEQLTARGSQP